MGSIEGVIILSSNNEPILTSHFTHPLSNYPSLHTDQLVAQLEKVHGASGAVSDATLPPVVYTEGIPHVEEDDDAPTSDEDGEEEVKTLQSKVAAKNGQFGAALVHIEHNTLRFVATFSTQVDPLVPLSFLHALLANLELYLGSPLTEDAIRDNFDVVYQILEEMLDESGLPFNTEYNTLRELVREPSWLDSIVSRLGGAVSGTSNAALGNAMSQPHISPIPWRRPATSATRTARNELYVDVVEVLSGVYARSSSSEQGRPVGPIGLRCRLEANCRLSGTPELLLRLTDAKRILDASLHPCVRIRRWKRESVLSFVPPEGAFRLADFQLESVSALERHIPVSLQCTREEPKSGSVTSTIFSITLRCNAASVEDIEVLFNVQERSTSIDTTLSGGNRRGAAAVAGEALDALKGTFHFDAKSGQARWAVGTMTREQSALQLRGTLHSGGGGGGDDVALSNLSNCVTCRFTVPQLCLSGVKVASLEVVNDVGYKPFKGVRSIVKGDLDWRW